MRKSKQQPPDGVKLPNVPSYIITKDLRVFSLFTNGYLKGRIDRVGYRSYFLTFPDKKARWYFEHRLFAEAFLPNPKNLPIVHHINHNRQDNRLENLEWCTQQTNLQHSKEAGRLKRTETTKKKISDSHKEENHYTFKGYYIYCGYPFPSVHQLSQSTGHTGKEIKQLIEKGLVQFVDKELISRNNPSA